MKNALLKLPKLSEQGSIIAAAALAGAGKLIHYHSQSSKNLNIRTKLDSTPVTKADEQSEKVITSLLKQKLPGCQIHGEEGGISGKSKNNIIVYIDPLDGTNPFIHRQKFSTVGIMICKGTNTLVSAIVLPFDKELMIAEYGKGAYLFKLDDNLEIISKALKLSVSSHNKIDGSLLYIDASFPPNKISKGKIRFLKKLVKAAEVGHMKFSLRMVGSNLHQQAQIAAGRGDITITDCIGGYYDLAGDLIIREAGGMFSDGNGQPVTVNTQLGIGSNGLIHNHILSLIKDSYKGYKGFNID